jgi:hypothetical protein
MGVETKDRLGIVRALIETAPDAAVRDLETALRGETQGSLSAVRALVRAEMSDRGVRDMVVGPILPLCSPRADGFKQALFPVGVMPRLWKAMRLIEPTAVTVVASYMTLGTDDQTPSQCDDLCAAAAKALRTGDRDMEPVIRFLEDFRAGAAVQFAGYLELTPLARIATQRLPAWLRNMTEEHAAAVRLLFKDADDIAPDASPRLMEILLAHVDEPWALLRLVSAVTNHANDRYLASSELAEFCERVLGDIERHVNAIRQFDYDGGPVAGIAAGEALGIAITEMLEFEACIELNRDGTWGVRLSRLKGALSNLVEGYLKKCSKLTGEALPMQPVRLGGAILRTEARLDEEPDQRLVRRALASLTFFERCRPYASQGGYGTVRSKVCEETTHGLDAYVEDILSLIHSGDVDNMDHARAFLEVAAEFMCLVQDEKSAQIVRRRAAAAQAA